MKSSQITAVTHVNKSMCTQTLSSWMFEGNELSGKKETSPSRKRDTALDAVCPANLTTSNAPKGNHTNLVKNTRAESNQSVQI